MGVLVSGRYRRRKHELGLGEGGEEAIQGKGIQEVSWKVKGLLVHLRERQLGQQEGGVCAKVLGREAARFCT